MEFEIIEQEKNIKVILKSEKKELARGTCYFENIGCIGDFDAQTVEAGIQLLNKCEQILKEKGVKQIIAPMNGNTWNKYRTIKYTNGDEPFLLENVNPESHNEIFLKAGFKELYTYTSTKGLIENAYKSKSLEIVEEKLKTKNIEIRKFNKKNYIEDLKKIYNISKVSFTRNPFYTVIDEQAFIKQYEQYIDIADEEVILIAEQEGKEIGFIFCIPNLNELKKQRQIETLIVKTVAVLPEYENLAIGNILLDRIAQIAKRKNFKQWIFAFMYSNNTSQKMAQRNKTEIIREYAIYGKEI